MVADRCYVSFIVGAYARVNDIQLLTIFGCQVFKSVGKKSVLFGIDWSQKNANHTS